MIGTTVSHYAIVDTLGQRRHGRGLQGHRHPPGTHCRAQVPVRRPVARPLGRRAVRPRGPGGVGPEPSPRLLGPRHRRARGAPLHRHGVPRGRAAQPAHRGQAAAAWTSSSTWASRSPTRWPRRTTWASCTATSSPPTSSSPIAEPPSCSTSGWPRPQARRPGAGATTAGTTLEHLTGPGSIVGTVAYMSPEQVRGEPLDARTDIFSLGAVLYEMATGRQAFSGTTSGTIHDAILNRAPVAPARVNPDVPARLEDVIDRALEKDRTLRYQNAADLRADLQRLRRDTDSGRAAAPSCHSTSSASSAVWRRPAALVAGTVALAAMLVAACDLRPADARRRHRFGGGAARLSTTAAIRTPSI